MRLIINDKIVEKCIKTLLFTCALTAGLLLMISHLQTPGDPNAPGGSEFELQAYKYGWNCPTLPSMYHSDVTLFIITPSKRQWVQAADLTRLSQTFRMVDNVHWIVVEDEHNKSQAVSHLLQRSCHPYTHLALPSSNETRKLFRNSKGMPQRNAGLDYLRSRFRLLPNKKTVLDVETKKVYADSSQVGVVYFADDDNTYDLQLFQFMRRVRTVGVWAVGIVGGATVEHPWVDNDTVVGWNVAYMKKRKFATDMAGFAVNLDLLIRNDNASFHTGCKGTLYETCLIEQLNVDLSQVQPFGFTERDRNDGKFRVYVWHTKTQGAGKLKILNEDFEI